MKVLELIERLRELDPEMDVMFEHPSHDYWKTVLTSEVSQVEENTVRYAEYHRQYVLAESEDDPEDMGVQGRKLVALIG